VQRVGASEAEMQVAPVRRRAMRGVMSKRMAMDIDRIRDFALHCKWYHTIQLAPDITTAGVYDHRPFLPQYGFSGSLAGQTVLDVGASDGFFSFEFERRGAASVLAIDTNAFDGSVAIDPSPAHREVYARKYSSYGEMGQLFDDVYEACGAPPGHNFLAAKALLNSRATYENRSVYDLPGTHTKFDFVFCGDLIEHLKNPLLALENMAAVTGSKCVIALSSVLPSAANSQRQMEYVGNISGGAFFHFSADAFREAILASGFRRVEIVSRFDLPNKRTGTMNNHAVYHCCR
jgi:tRNA (mo5U34)-methyltransferase